MEYFSTIFNQRLKALPTGFIREPFAKGAWENRLLGIKGARGVGKTTLLLQYAKLNLPLDDQSLYVSLDDIFFTSNRLSDLISDFVKNGGRYLLLDEVHRYANWSIEIKNIYDNYPELEKIIFTGSSILELAKAPADLSRRAVMFEMPGLSFREFLALEGGHHFPVFSLEQVQHDHLQIARDINEKIKPLVYFKKYLEYGYYPYYKENKAFYHQKILQDIYLIIESDLAFAEGIGIAHQEKMKKLLYVLAGSPPFTPNMAKLSTHLELSRNTLKNSLQILSKAQLIGLLYADPRGVSLLQKPDKIFLHHPNLYYAIAREGFDRGSLRETFFYNQVGAKHQLAYPKTADFLVDRKFLFEIGGKNKKTDHAAETEGTWLVKDDIEYGYKNQIPLWLMGFLY
ncbi:MAG: AAA family ATPase [Bacteroidales bacterium]|jgi:predicted AAA+ superfamily ATPase|nr:AAA family ATPase [Bacteroidales bacterium]